MISVEAGEHSVRFRAWYQNPIRSEVMRLPRHVSCTDHSRFPVLAIIFFGKAGARSTTQVFSLEGFERSGQNADDNDGGGFSCQGSWDDSDEMSQAAGKAW